MFDDVLSYDGTAEDALPPLAASPSGPLARSLAVPHPIADCHTVATLLKDLGNPCRLKVLWMLCERERSVGEMEACLDLSQSALSQHLCRLRQARLVRTRRDRQKIYYSLARPVLRPLIQMIARSSSAMAACARSEIGRDEQAIQPYAF